jgi:hypothetical protein
MSLYWVVETEVPIDKVVAVSRYLQSQPWFAGIKIRDDNFPLGIATILFRIASRRKFPSKAFDTILDDKLGVFHKIKIYHTPHDKDTWEPAHFAKKITKLGKHPGIRKLGKQGVLILGKDSEGHHFLELMLVKKFLVERGYKHAILLKLKEDIPNQSLSQKVKMWGLLCRFTIIVDRTPAGHLTEFEMLKCQDTVIAILRPKGYRSTFMMDSHPQSSLVTSFEFERSPFDRMGDVIKWAETVVKKNEAYYNEEYEWRKEV